MRYPCGRNFSYFQNVPQNEIHLHQRYANVLAISHIVHLTLFPYILIHLPCLSQSHVSQICCIFDQLCSRHFSLSPTTICLFKYIIRPINIPQFSKKKICITENQIFCKPLFNLLFLHYSQPVSYPIWQ